METINLTIPNMKSAHCMMTVTSVLNKLEGANLKNILPGAAEIELTGTTRSAVVEAIEKAGYNVTNK